MASIDSSAKQKYMNGSYEKIVTVVFPDLGYTVPEEEVYFESLDLRESILDSESFEAVGCIASSLSISIRSFDEEIKGEKIVVYITIDDDVNNRLKLFTGYVDDVALEGNSKVRKITAYDQLYKIADDDVSTWYNNLTFPITLGSFRSLLLTRLGINTNSSFSLVNDSVQIVKQFEPSSMNGLNVLKQICQINGVFGIMNRDGYFEFRTLVTTSTGAEHLTDYKKLEYQEFMIDPLDKISIKDTENSPATSYGIGSNTYVIQGNMFAYGMSSEDRYTMAQRIHGVLANVTYYPFESEHNGLPWIEVGDNCNILYDIYDFENSTQSQDVYTTVRMTVFNRQLKGIQAIQDTYSIGGLKDQHEFVSSIGSDMTYIEKQMEELKTANSSEVAFYRNSSVITGSKDALTMVFDIVYEAKRGEVILFNAELSLDVVGDSVLPTLNDPYFEIQYMLNGRKLPYNSSKGRLFEGKHNLALAQYWISGNDETNRLQGFLKPSNASFSIQKNMSHAFITIKDSMEDTFDLEITHDPNKTTYFTDEPLDYTGLVISKVYSSGQKTDITSLCTFAPPEGTTYSTGQLVTVVATYTEQDETGAFIEYTIDFDVDIEPDELTGLYIVTPPNKLTYFVGDSFTVEGIKVEAEFANGSRIDVTNSVTYSLSPGTIIQENTMDDITVSYTFKGITEDDDFSIVIDTTECTMPTELYYIIRDVNIYTGVRNMRELKSP